VSDGYDELLAYNRRWAAGHVAEDPLYFERMAEGQSPDFLFIGCSDSRVSAQELTGTHLGEMFVHRNIANLVVHTDMNLMSVLQFAVDVLQVGHVIVCGHFQCGGVRAAVDGHFHGLIDKWLRTIKDVYRIYREELDAIEDPEERHRRLVELNVREQVFRLRTTSFVQRAMRDRDLKVHGWVYDLDHGLIRDLGIDPTADFDAVALYDYDDL
jgi:carbonic anhydrase